MMPGMPDLSQLLMQAQQMQADMVRAQASLSETEVTGSAGGGAVTAVVNGAGDLLRIRIDPAVVDASDVETLEDLVVAAVHDARRAAEKLAGEAMGSVAGGLDLSAMGLPPGLGLPGGGFGGAVDDGDEYDEDDEDEDEDEEEDEDGEEDDEADFADARAIDEETDEVYRREFEREQLEQDRLEENRRAQGGQEPGGPAQAGTPGPATPTGT